ncbi:MAG: general secretion pathway protein GspK [Magnetococcales bacterium]|nr:general secretion pathway protein GspK [Magnetococcales bacterium]
MSGEAQPEPMEAIANGFMLDYVSDRPVKETSTVLVRQRVVRELIHEYGFSPEDMAIDFPMGVRKKIDIAIFHHDQPHALEYLGRAVLCCSEPRTERNASRTREFDQAATDLEDLETVMRGIKAIRYGFWTNGLESFFLEKDDQSSRFEVRLDPVADWPAAEESQGIRDLLPDAHTRVADNEQERTGDSRPPLCSRSSWPPYPKRHESVSSVNGYNQRKNRGFALVAVLWVIVVLSLIMMAFSADTRIEVKLVYNTIEHTQMMAIADGGIEIAIYSLLNSNSKNRWSPNGAFHEVKMKKGYLRINVLDEGGKIDLNMASKELLQRFFSSLYADLEIPPSLADSIIEWRDKNNLRQLNHDEDADYREAGLAYGAKHAPFESVEELRLVLGMTDEIYAVVHPAVTVYSQQAEPDKKTAPVQVLKALSDLSETELNKILAERELSKEFDEHPLESNIGVYRIQSEAKSETGVSFLRYAVVRLTGIKENPFLIYEIGRSKITEGVLDPS